MAALGFSPSEMPFAATHSWSFAYQLDLADELRSVQSLLKIEGA